LTENAGHEIDGHEIGEQNMYRLRIDYITMQYAIFFEKNGRTQVTAARKYYRFFEIHKILQKHQPKLSIISLSLYRKLKKKLITNVSLQQLHANDY